MKSAYHCINNRQPSQQDVLATSSYWPTCDLWPKIWNMHTPPRIRTFICSLYRNALPTAKNLHRRKIIPNPICSLCNKADESVEYIFLLCPWTKQIWNHPRMNIPILVQKVTRFDIWHLNYHSLLGIDPTLEQVALLP